MHGPKRKPLKPKRIDRGLHLVPGAIDPKMYSGYVLDKGITHIISLSESGQKITDGLKRAGITAHNFPMVIGHNVVEKPGGIGIFNVKLVPRESFSDAGRRNLLLGAMKARELISSGHEVAFTCRYGSHRSRRAHYIYRRLFGDDHEKAMSASKADPKEAGKLRDTWENRHIYLHS